MYDPFLIKVHEQQKDTLEAKAAIDKSCKQKKHYFKRIAVWLVLILSILGGPALFATSLPLLQIAWSNISVELIIVIAIMWAVNFAAVWTLFGIISYLGKGLKPAFVLAVFICGFCCLSRNVVLPYLKYYLSSILVVRLNDFPPATICSSWPMGMIPKVIWAVLCGAAGVIATWFFNIFTERKKISLSKENAGICLKSYRMSQSSPIAQKNFWSKR